MDNKIVLEAMKELNDYPVAYRTGPEEEGFVMYDVEEIELKDVEEQL